MKKFLIAIVILSELLLAWGVSAQTIAKPAQGGTGIATYTIGDIIYASATKVLSKLGIGSNGDCLKITLGLPSWGSCGSGGGGGTDGNWSFFNTSGIRLATTSNQVLIGASATTTTNALEVIGRGYFTQGILAPASSTIDQLSVRNGTTTNATSTNISVLNLTATGSTTLQNFTFLNATGTSATTTNSFSTTASSTNLFGALINGFGLSSCTGTNALTWSGGSFSCTAQPQGTVTAVSVASANGFAGSSSGGATPALTLTTTISGVLKGNGTAISAAANGTDYTLLSATTCGAGQHISAVTASGGVTCSLDTDTVNSKWATTSNYINPNVAGTGILVNSASSTITNLVMVNATSTSATTTNLAVTNLTQTGQATGCATYTSGVLTSTGIACGTGSGSGANSKWATTSTYINPNVAGTGILVNSASSTITNLTMFVSTSSSATSTSLFATTASTTNFYGAGLLGGSGCAGSTFLQYSGSTGQFGCGTPAGGGGSGASIGEAWAFGPAKAWLAPTTTVGIIVNASSTIGNATQGLTVNGPATTTGQTILASGGGFVGIGNTNPTQTLDVTGNIKASGSLTAGTNSQISGTGGYSALAAGNTYMWAPADGVMEITNSSVNGFTRLDFGGVTSSFPALGRSGTSLLVQLADGTAGGSLGVATNSPATALDVNGYVKVLQTSTTTACSAAIQGSIFYNQANNNFWGCGSGSTWTQFGAGSVSGGGGTNFFTNSGIYTYLTTGTNLGIGTTTPYAPLSVMGQVVATNFTATSTTATSTFSGGLVVGNGGLVYDLNTATTTINQLDLGNLSFAQDSGVINALDFPVVNAANSTPEAMNFGFNLGSTTVSAPLFTLYAQSNGVSGIKLSGVGVGTSSPTSLFTVGTSTSATATTTIFFDSGVSKGTCMVMKDMTGNTYTYLTAQSGVLTASTKDCRI